MEYGNAINDEALQVEVVQSFPAWTYKPQRRFQGFWVISGKSQPGISRELTNEYQAGIRAEQRVSLFGVM